MIFVGSFVESLPPIKQKCEIREKHPRHVLSTVALTVPWLTKKVRVRVIGLGLRLELGLGLELGLSGGVVFFGGSFPQKIFFVTLH